MRVRIALALFLAAGCGRQEVLGLGGVDFDAAIAEDARDPFDGGEGIDVGPTFWDGGEGPDLGPPIPFDAGPIGDALPRRDMGLPPPPDSGPRPDSGARTDAGTPPIPDSGPRPDSGVQFDAGPPPECMTDRDCGFGGGRIAFCEPMTRTCVECLTDANCGRGRVCDVAAGYECRVQCVAGRCPPGSTCDQAANVCVGCLSNMDCNNGDVCDPRSRSCVACVSNADCGGRPGVPVCDTSTHQCVECASNADCTLPEVCEASSHECRAPSGRPLCEPCNDDAQCGGPSDLCLGFSLGGGQFSDRTCAQDCANAPCPRGFECINTRGTQRQCRPEYAMNNPTCEAIRHLGDACTPSSSTSDPGCGLTGYQDARCEPNPAGQNVCTIWCQSADHCPVGFTCTGATNNQPGRCF